MNIITAGQSDAINLPAVASSDSDYGHAPASNGLLRILRRRFALILTTVLLVVGAAIIALALATPVYKASALMQLDESATATSKPVASMDQAAPVREIEQQLDYSMRVQIDALKSRPVARKVVAELQLHTLPEFNPGGFKPISQPAPAPVAAPPVAVASAPGSQSASAPVAEAAAVPVSPAPVDPLALVPPSVVERTIDALLAHVTAEQVGTTSFIKVSAESTDPKLATKIANALVQSYVATRTGEIADTNRRMIADMSARTDQLSERLRAADFAVSDFKRRHGIDAGFALNASAAQIEGAAREVASARGASAEAATIAAGQRSAGSATSSLLTSLRNQESTLSSKLANLQTQYGARHPDVMSTAAELDQVRAAVATEEARASANVMSTSAGAGARAGQLAGELGGLRAKARGQDMARPELAALEREVETLNSLYLGMLEKVKDLQIRSVNPRPEAVPVSVALVPGSPSFPKTGQTLAVALIASIILGIILALIVESFDTRLRSGEQIAQLTALPTFAMIPQRGTIPNLIERQDGGSTTPAVAPKSVFAEAFRDGFLEIMSRVGAEKSSVILITSALPGEGKTTVCLGTAVSAVTQGMRAIVVDFDFRRRGLTKLLELTDFRPGLQDYLKGDAPLEKCIAFSPKAPGLACLTVSEVPDNPSELFEMARLEELFTALRAQYDFIVIDTPPTMALRDAKVLAQFADASIMTARWGKSSPETIRSVTRIMGSALIGVIITRVDYAKHARFAYGDSIQYYSKYSSYYNDNEAADDDSGYLTWFQRFKRRFSGS